MAMVPSDMTLLHALSYVYLYFSKRSDGELSDEEVAVLYKKVHEWAEDKNDIDTTTKAVKEAAEWYDSMTDDERNKAIAEQTVIFSQLSVDARKAILEDLRALANADGKVTEGEVMIFNLIAKTMGIELN